MNIIVQINPDPDGVRCGECKGLNNSNFGPGACDVSRGQKER